MNILKPNINDTIYIKTRNGSEIIGRVISAEHVIVIQPNNRNMIVVIEYDMIEYYGLMSDNISNFLKSNRMNKVKKRTDSILELRKRQKELEEEEYRARLNSFEPSGSLIEYGDQINQFKVSDVTNKK